MAISSIAACYSISATGVHPAPSPGSRTGRTEFDSNQDIVESASDPASVGHSLYEPCASGRAVARPGREVAVTPKTRQGAADRPPPRLVLEFGLASKFGFPRHRPRAALRGVRPRPIDRRYFEDYCTLRGVGGAHRHHRARVGAAARRVGRLALGNARVLAGVMAIVIAWRSEHVILTVVTGRRSECSPWSGDST
jgi:hypothetical protein